MAQDAELLHFFLPEAYLLGGAAAWLRGRRPRIMSRRGTGAQYQDRYPLVRRLEGALHRRMDAVLAQTKRMSEELRAEGAPEERLGILPNGIEMAPWQAQDRVRARAALGLAPEGLVLLSVGNLHPYKGFDILLSALAGLTGALPKGWCCLIAGEDRGAGAALDRQAREAGLGDEIRFLGRVDALPQLYAAADLFVLPSRTEGFSNATLEAMASGLPVISTAVSGAEDLVVPGATGEIVPVADAETLGAAIVALAAAPERRRTLGRAGQERARRHFSLEAMVQRYARLYRGLIETPRRPVQALLEDHPA